MRNSIFLGVLVLMIGCGSDNNTQIEIKEDVTKIDTTKGLKLPIVPQTKDENLRPPTLPSI